MFLHVGLTGRSDIIVSFPHPDVAGSCVSTVITHISLVLSVRARLSLAVRQNIGLPLVHPGLGQQPQLEVVSTSAMLQANSDNPCPFSSSGHAIKETEAANHRGSDLAMHQKVNGDDSGVLQHQDAGRVPNEEGLLRYHTHV
jgi:hypothetical protein